MLVCETEFVAQTTWHESHLADSYCSEFSNACSYPRRARSAIGVDTVLTLDVCLYVCMLAL